MEGIEEKVKLKCNRSKMTSIPIPEENILIFLLLQTYVEPVLKTTSIKRPPLLNDHFY